MSRPASPARAAVDQTSFLLGRLVLGGVVSSHSQRIFPIVALPFSTPEFHSVSVEYFTARSYNDLV